MRALFCILTCVFVLAACAPSVDAVDERSCQVYRAFYELMPGGDRHIVATRTAPFKNAADWPGGPAAFERHDMHSVEDSLLVIESFAHDTSAYFSAVMQDDARDVRGCFAKSAPRPEFFAGSAEQLAARWREAQREPGLWRFSPVAFSDDGRHALIYVEFDCQGWCGYGIFFLFERRSEMWSYVGDQWVWFA